MIMIMINDACSLQVPNTAKFSHSVNTDDER